MKCFTKIVVTVSLIIGGLCYTPKPAKADMFGVADAGLLVQQILQYIQDWDLGDFANLNLDELVENIEKKVDGMRKIVNIFEAGQQGIATFNNTVEVTKKLTKLTRTMNSYIRYMGTIGEDFEIERCYTIYRKFDRQTAQVLRQMKSVLSSLKKMDSEEGSNILMVMDKVITEASATLDMISNECLTEIGNEIHEHKMRAQGEAVTETNNTAIV